VRKLSLRGTDVIVPYREATPERRENLYTVLRHLAYTYCDYQLWLVEADAAPRFDWARLSDPAIRHVFVPATGPFPKSFLYNTAVRLCRSPVVCFHDADCVSRPSHLHYCVERLLDIDGSDVPGEGTGVICPFQSMINVAGETKQSFIQSPDFAILEPLAEADPLPADASLLYPYNVGGIVVCRRKLYIALGGCNPECQGWGSEDNELFVRATRLGVDWQAVIAPMFHLHHDSATREGYSETEQGKRNRRVEDASREMPVPELQALAQRMSRFFD
jgi:hypothetical protein